MAVPVASANAADVLRTEGDTATNLGAIPTENGASRFRDNGVDQQQRWSMQDIVDQTGAPVADGAVIDTFVIDLDGNAGLYSSLNNAAAVAQGGAAKLDQRTQDAEFVVGLTNASLDIMFDENAPLLYGASIQIAS